MAALWLPSDDRHTLALREPNLLVPGKQPLGRCELKSRKSVLAGLFDNKNTYLSSYGLTKIGVTELNNGLSFDSVTDRADTNIISPSETTASWCVIVFTPQSYGSGNSFGRILSNSDADAAPDIYLRSTSTGLTFRSVDGSGGTNDWNTGGFTWGNEYCLVFAQNGTGIVKGYLTNLDTLTTITEEFLSSIWTSTHASFRIGNRPANDRGFDGTIKFVGVFEGHDGFNFGRQISRNPYQLLKPANSTPYLISVPTGGATVTLSNPLAAANGQNGWSGSCDVTYA